MDRYDGPEDVRQERERLKELYKQELRLKKQQFEALQQAKRQAATNAQLEKLAQMGQDDSEVWVGKLNEQAAKNEAMVEMALEGTYASPSLDPLAEFRPQTESTASLDPTVLPQMPVSKTLGEDEPPAPVEKTLD